MSSMLGGCLERSERRICGVGGTCSFGAEHYLKLAKTVELDLSSQLYEATTSKPEAHDHRVIFMHFSLGPED